MKRVPIWVMVAGIGMTILASRYQSLPVEMLVESEALAEPEALVAGMGATDLFGQVLHQDFDHLEYSQFVATGYAIGKPYSTITKAGEPLINIGWVNIGGINIVTVAVDPKVVPLGSVIYIEGVGLGLATDTGRLIKGNRIDICFQNMDDAIEWGKKDVDVYMLREGA